MNGQPPVTSHNTHNNVHLERDKYIGIILIKIVVYEATLMLCFFTSLCYTLETFTYLFRSVLIKI